MKEINAENFGLQLTGGFECLSKQYVLWSFTKTQRKAVFKKKFTNLKFQHPFQLGVDIGSSTVARGVVSLVLGYLSNLVIEMAFLIQVKQLYSQTVKQINKTIQG